MRTEISDSSSRPAKQPFGLRRLSRRYLCSCGLTIALVAGLEGQALAQPSGQGQLRDFGLTGMGTGWAQVRNQLFWTSTNGTAWQEITPRASSARTIDRVFFLDNVHGWAVLSGATAPGQLAVASTRDAGRTWTTVPLTKNANPDLRRYAGNAFIFFPDDAHGWVAVRLASGSNFNIGLLFATSDGGLTWIALPYPPAADHLYFRDQTTGWIAGGRGGDGLWITHDGGRSWQAQTLALPPACSGCRTLFDVPAFRSALSGILPVTLLGPEQSFLAAYSSRDGGLSWHLDGIGEAAQRPNRLATGVVDGHLVFATGNAHGGVITVGASGSLVSKPEGLWPLGDVLKANFSTDQAGWLLYAAGNCESFKSNCSQQRELVATGDGGATFSLITPQASSGQVPPDIPTSALLAASPVRQDQPYSGQASASEIFGTWPSQGEGFDQCEAGTATQMQTWWDLSPYTTTGIYIGGENRGCRQPNLTPNWIATVTGYGWGLMPLWVGPQATCTSCRTKSGQTCPTMSSDPASAATQGASEADKAVAAAQSLGFNDSIIYYDLEYYKGSTSCHLAAQSFINGWVGEIHTKGFLAGAYGESFDASADWSANVIDNPPDVVWFKDWDENDSVWDSSLSNSLWTDHQRIHQFCSDGTAYPCTKYSDSFGGVTFAIDGDVMDAPVVPGQYLSFPTLLSPNNGASNVGTIPSFSWTSVSGAAYYRLVIASNAYQLPLGPDAPPCTPACLVDQHVTTPSYTIPSGVLQDGTAYYWEVQAGGQLRGLWSVQSSFSTSTTSGGLNSLTASPSTVNSGGYTQLTVTLSGPAPAGGAVVTLSSMPATVLPVPQYITIAAGQTSANLFAQAGTVGTSTPVTITGAYNTSGRYATVQVQPPSRGINTQQATSITSDSAVLNGTVDPNGSSGYVYFYYGTSPTSLSSSCSAGSVTPSYAVQPFSCTAQGLPPNTTYYFAVAFEDSNTAIYSYGSTLKFLVPLPGLVTKAASPITSDSAVLNGTVDPNGSSGYVYFYYGTSPTNLSSSCSAGSVAPSYAVQPFSCTAQGLPPNTTYYFEIVFEDSNTGIYTYGKVRNFTTF